MPPEFPSSRPGLSISLRVGRTHPPDRTRNKAMVRLSAAPSKPERFSSLKSLSVPSRRLVQRRWCTALSERRLSTAVVSDGLDLVGLDLVQETIRVCVDAPVLCLALPLHFKSDPVTLAHLAVDRHDDGLLHVIDA